MTGCSAAESPAEPGTGEAASEIAGPITVDNTGAIRSVVMVDGCSGILLSSRVAMSAAHCWARKKIGCDPPYAPDQGVLVSDPLIGSTVKVAPANSADFQGPGVEEYGIASIRFMPAHSSNFGTLCCEPGFGYCGHCEDGPTLFQNTVKTNQAHDLAIVYLAEPIEGIPLDKVAYGAGTSFPYFGAYDFEPADLLGVTLVTAGTSNTTAAPTGKLRAYGTFAVDSIQATAASPFVAVTDSSQCEPLNDTPPEIYLDLNAPGAFLQYNASAQGAACAVGGDSGGPTFLNAPALGGDVFAGLPSGRLVVGNHSGGSSGPTTCGTNNQDSTTWNLPYTLEGKPVLGQNGDFMRESLTDFDDDGWVDAEDNCVTAFNPKQNNCNEAAEDAKGYERRGDLCDPRPCAQAWIMAGTKYVGSSSGTSTTVQIQHGIVVRDKFEVDPRPSMPHYFGSTNATAGDAALAVSNVPTKYRFCQNDPLKLVSCSDPSIVDNFLVDLPDDTIGPGDPYLRMHVEEPGAPGVGFHEETFDYDGQSKVVRQWSYQADKATWTSIINNWISPTGGSGLFGTTSGLSGAILIHSDTDAGRFSDSTATGYRVALDGTTSGDEDLANHLQPYAPDGPFTVVSVGAWTPWPYFEWIKPWDPWDWIKPGWDGVRQEASTIIRGYEGHFARILRTGEAIQVDSEIGAGLKTLMQGSAVWGPAAEASLGQAYKGPDHAPHAIAFKPDGRDVFDGAWFESGIRGNAADTGEPSLARSGGPTARTGFVPVYSRADDLAFVVGGVSGGSPTGEIWFRSVVESGVPWTRIELAGGYTPAYVVAATWSFREHKLWLLDHDGAGTARLARVHPTTGHVDLLLEANWTGDYDKHWLRLALDGRVLLFASSTARDAHGAALFDYVPMATWSPVTVAALQIEDDPLLYRPNVDPHGMTFVTSVRGRVAVIRQDAVGGSPAELTDIGALL